MSLQPSLEGLMQKIRSLPSEKVAEVEHFVEIIQQRSLVDKLPASHQENRFDFPVDRLGSWPQDLSLHREDMYNDGGR